MIIDSPNSLLYIEPKNELKLNSIIGDKYLWFLLIIDKQVKNKQIGGYDKLNDSLILNTSFRGVHNCICGKRSTNFDILLPNNMITNSLSYHYILHHTDEIPQSEWLKLEKLYNYLNFKN